MLSRTKSKGILKTYRSYNFVDKDPIIDYCRTAVFTDGGGPVDVSKNSGVSSATLYKWFNGKTKRPQFATVAAVLMACGEPTLDLRKIIKRDK